MFNVSTYKKQLSIVRPSSRIEATSDTDKISVSETGELSIKNTLGAGTYTVKLKAVDATNYEDPETTFDVIVPTNSYEKVEIIFADHNSKLGRLAVRNFEEDGTLHQHFDIVKVGSKNEGYSFDISIPDGEYIRGFKKLEIGEYDLKDTKWILFHFRDLEIASCHLNEMDYLELCDFFCDVMPNCKIIN